MAKNFDHGGSGARKTNSLLNLIGYRPGIDKMYLHIKDSYEPNYLLLIGKRQKSCIKQLNDPKTCIDFSSDRKGVYQYINVNNPEKDLKILIMFDDITADNGMSQ